MPCIWSVKADDFSSKSRLRLAFSSKKRRNKYSFVLHAKNNNCKIIDISARGEKCLQEALSHSQQPDMILVAGSSVIFPAAFLNGLTIPIINIHPALLPAYRGPAPSHALVLNDDADNFGGMTAHLLVSKIDAGAIIKQYKVALSDYPTIAAWTLAATRRCDDLVRDGIIPYLQGQLTPTQQDEQLASYHALKDVPQSISADMSLADAENFILKAPEIYTHTKVDFVDAKNRTHSLRVIGSLKKRGLPTGMPAKRGFNRLEMDLSDARVSFRLNHRMRRCWEKIKRSLSLSRSNKH
ncbi:MAG: formyltransferase family protein [Hyphomicrobiales bacterium]